MITVMKKVNVSEIKRDKEREIQADFMKFCAFSFWETANLSWIVEKLDRISPA